MKTSPPSNLKDVKHLMEINPPFIEERNLSKMAVEKNIQLSEILQLKNKIDFRCVAVKARKLRKNLERNDGQPHIYGELSLLFLYFTSRAARGGAGSFKR